MRAGVEWMERFQVRLYLVALLVGLLSDCAAFKRDVHVIAVDYYRVARIRTGCWSMGAVGPFD